MKDFRELGKVTPIFSEDKSEEKNRSWVRVLNVGKMVYHGEDIEFSLEDLQKIADNTNKLIENCKKYADEGRIKVEEDGVEIHATPWRPPFLREHGSKRDGESGGSKVLECKTFANALWTLIEWSDEEYALVVKESLEFVSVGLRGEYQDFAGESYTGGVLWEVSGTTHPKVKSIGRIQNTLNLELSENEGEKLMEELKEIKEMLQALMQAVQALSEDAEANEDEDVDDDVEAGEEAAEVDVEASENEDEDVEAMKDQLEELKQLVVKLSESSNLLTQDIGNGGPKPVKAVELTDELLQAKAEELGSAEAALAWSFEAFPNQ